jgi:peptidoglycan/xylan/chitin deacetylase (PgdA/CDA1 family)
LDGKKRLEEIIGKEVLFFSYPNGSYSEREKARVQGYYKMAVTVKMRHISPLSDDIYELPRICMTGNFITDKIKFYGIWLFLRKVLYTITRKARFKPVMEAY